MTTVSHVLNTTRFVSPATRRRVMKAIQALGYYRDAHARLLARGQADLVGLIVSDIENPAYPELIKHIEAETDKYGFDFLLRTADFDPLRIKRAVRKMIENRVGG